MKLCKNCKHCVAMFRCHDGCYHPMMGIPVYFCTKWCKSIISSIDGSVSKQGLRDCNKERSNMSSCGPTGCHYKFSILSWFKN